MTKINRVKNILQGTGLLLFALILFIDPEDGLSIVVALFALGLTLRGFGTLYYYYKMGRQMVGGRFILYRGLFFLDAGIFSTTLANAPDIYLIIYIAIVDLFAALIALLRARESRKIGSRQWILRTLYGIGLLLLVSAALVNGIYYRRTDTAVYVYALGTLYSAIRKIGSSFQRTAIAYIP